MAGVEVSCWYASGLAFECLRCGRCCAGPQEGYVWVSDEEVRALADFLGLEVNSVLDCYVRRVGTRNSLVEEGQTKDCIFLTFDGDARARCRVHPVRPTQCRTWPFWPSNLLDPDRWQRAAQGCAGINRGALHNLDEIRSQREQTHS
jgi:hypothetical protein